MNIFEENRKKYEIKSKKDLVTMAFSLIFGGGFLCLFIITAVIGIPLMIIGFLMLLVAPFWKPKKVN